MFYFIRALKLLFSSLYFSFIILFYNISGLSVSITASSKYCKFCFFCAREEIVLCFWIKLDLTHKNTDSIVIVSVDVYEVVNTCGGRYHQKLQQVIEAGLRKVVCLLMWVLGNKLESAA